MDKSLRLRLIVQRNGVPDVRILSNVSLANDPTISQLLEQVNETIPLEDAHGEWGLDDYVVELHDKNGHAFECLHFQHVATVLDRDDEVFIRPLSTLDLKKRRLSGRDQILSGGEHLIDGVPFGRPRLRAPRSRPAIHIAPRKRRRLNYDQDLDVDDFDDYSNEDEDMDDYTGLQPRDQDDSEKEQGLLLTQFGESGSKSGARHVHFPASATASAELENPEVSEDEESVIEDDEEDEGDEEDTFNPDPQELADELSDLKDLAEEEAWARSLNEAGGHDRFHTPNEDVREHTEEQSVSSLDGEGRINSRTRSERQTRSQGLAGQRPVAGRSSQESDAIESKAAARSPSSSLDSSLLDKIMAIRSAFPQVSSNDCQKLLMKHGKDVSRTWRTLEKSLKPRQGLAETMVFITQLELPREVMIVSSPPRQPAEHLGEVSRIDEDEESEASSDEKGSSDDSASSSDEENESDDSDSDSNSEAIPTRPSPRAKKVVEDSSQDTSEDSSSEDSSSDDGSDSQSENDDHVPSKRTKDARHEQNPAGGLESPDSSSEGSSSSDSSSDSEPTVTRRPISRPGRRMVVQSSQSLPASSKAIKAARAASTRVSARTIRTRSASKTSRRVEVSSSSPSSESDERNVQGSRSVAEAVTKPSARAAPKAVTHIKPGDVPTPQASDPPPVPPGQGKTRTQKRNQRRRLETQRKKTALEAVSSHHRSQDSTMTDVLMAKKNALLQTLGSQSKVVNEGTGDAKDALATDEESADNPSKGPDDWKRKISYRAVECVQEGIVDISEPPFPFYQRWDPQLQQDPRSTSQRRNKRKSRDSSQFYDSSNLPSHKKRRQDEYSRQIVDEYSYQEDTTTFPANQDDVTLNYDDISFNPDVSQLPAKEKEADEDDLPQLPEDMSSLPELLLKNLEEGAIVAWKQLLCTEATNWQPQLSEFMTAIIVEADSVTGHLQVQLAKRDRNVEKIEKKFDEETGQRIYGKFEVPDEDDEDEEDLGFRDLVLPQMMDARLVRPAEQPSKNQSTDDNNGHDNCSDQIDGAVHDRAPQLSELEFEVADSQPKRDSKDISGASGNDQNQSRTLDHDTQSRIDQWDQNISQDVESDAAIPADALDESFIAETNHDIPRGEDKDDDHMGIDSPVDRVSICDARREEISQLIKAEGFRQEVRASIDQSSFLRLGSPSRQLEEECASSMHRKVSCRRPSSEAPSEYGSKDPSQQVSQQPVVDVDPEAFHSAPQTPRNQQDGSDDAGSQEAGELRASLKRTDSLKLGPSQFTEASARSGRQPDDNFTTHSDDLGIEPPVESPEMMAFEDDDDAATGDANSRNEQAARAQTPVPRVYNGDLQSINATKTTATRSKPNDHESSPHGSVSSPRSSDSFPDVEVLWSRMATKKFKELPTKIKNEESSQINLLDSKDLARPAQVAKSQENTKAFWSSPARSTRSSGKSKGKDSTNSTPKGKLKVTSFDTSVSPPVLPKPRQKTRASSGSAEKATNASDKGLKASGSALSIPEGSQVVSLMTSSPEPEPEDEPEYTEMYADDSLDDDYHGDSPHSLRASQKKTRQASKSGTKRGASVPAAESKESTASTNWVPGSQGPSRKASGRFGGRWS